MNDFAQMIAADSVEIRRLLPGPIERVWDYLTDSEKRGTWLASGEIEQRVGGKVEHVFRNSELTAHDDAPPPKYAQYGSESRMQGRVTACDPPRRLSYTWPEDNGGESEVSFELSPHASGDVVLVVTHRRLATRDEMLSVAAGWHTHLGILIDRLSGREPPPFWSTHTRLEAEYEQRIPADPANS